MKALRLEFTRRTPGGQIRPAVARLCLLVVVGASALAVVGGVIGSGLAAKAAEKRNEAMHLRADRESLVEAARTQAALPAETVESINGVVSLLNYPLLGMLEQMERHADLGVSLLSVELGAVRTSIRLTVQANGLPEVLNYVDAMREEPAFRELVVVRQEAAAREGESLRFTLEVPQVDAVQRATASPAAGGRS